MIVYNAETDGHQILTLKSFGFFGFICKVPLYTTKLFFFFQSRETQGCIGNANKIGISIPRNLENMIGDTLKLGQYYTETAPTN